MASAQPGRYQRSTNGLVGALLVMLVVIGGYVALRSFARGNQDVSVPSVDYLPLMSQARTEGRVSAPGPSPMPTGWRATSVRYTAGAHPRWHLGLLTEKKTYVGIEESDRRVSSMVAAYVGEGAEQGRARRLAGRTWQTWRDGSTYALTWTQDQDTVLVGGAAGEKAVVQLVSVLELRG